MVNLEIIILSVLGGGPAHGYMLKQTIEATYGKRYVKMSNSSLYPRLARMEAGGYIDGELRPQEKVPDRKIYRITPAGLQHLKEMLAAPLGLREDLFDYKVRAVMFGLLSREERRKVTEPLYEEKRKELEEAEAKRTKFGQYMDRYGLTVLDHGIEELEVQLKLFELMMEME